MSKQRSVTDINLYRLKEIYRDELPEFPKPIRVFLIWAGLVLHAGLLMVLSTLAFYVLASPLYLLKWLAMSVLGLAFWQYILVLVGIALLVFAYAAVNMYIETRKEMKEENNV